MPGRKLRILIDGLDSRLLLTLREHPRIGLVEVARRLGVAREWVCKRRKVEERRLRREDLLAADEVFITNSWLGVMPIATIEGRPLGQRRVGPKLSAEWENHLRKE